MSRDGTTACPTCGHGVLEPFLKVEGVPVFTTVMWPTRHEALEAPRGDLSLAMCDRCGMVRNTSFDLDLVAYTPGYENSLHFSPTFQRYAGELARRLTDRYALTGRTVVEIGSGKGEFLSQLCEVTGGAGIGFDPTYAGEVADAPGSERVTVVRDYYSEKYVAQEADLVCCRHVLEHLDDPAGLLRSLRRTLGTRTTPVYFEVPNARFVFGPAGLWDLIYQHVSYFGREPLRHLFERCGFRVVAVSDSFHGQFLSLEARPGEWSAAVPPPGRAAVRELREQISGFPTLFHAAVEDWDAALHSRPDGPAVLWGAGAKGITFLNLTDSGRRIDAVVDLNPRKQGAFVPGTGQRVLAPEELVALRPGLVVVANPVYEDEISRQVRALGLDAEVRCV